MFPIGVAALDQGYYGAAPSYWKAKELEDTQQAYALLGQTFQNMSGPQGPSGGQGMIPGGMPMQPPGMPTGGPPGAPGGAPPQMPTTPQGTLGSIIPSPAAGPAAIPQTPGAMPPAQAPGPTGSPASSLSGSPGPFSGGPGPTFTNMLGGPGARQTQSPPTPQPPPAITQALGPAPYDWRTIAATIAQSNPNASPAVIARAVTMMVPFMQMDSQNQWKQISAQLQQERLGETERYHDASLAAKREGYELRGQEDEDRERRFQQTQAGIQKRFESTEQWRTAEAARKDAMSAATLDKQDFDRKFNIWRQKQTQLDRAMRAEITAKSNLTGEPLRRALARIDEMRGQVESDMQSFRDTLPDRAQQGTPAMKGATGTKRVDEGFSGLGQGKQQPISPEQESALKDLLAQGKYTKDQLAQWLQQRNIAVPDWLN